MPAAVQLTDAKIKGLKPPATGQEEHSDSVVPGLRIRVSKGGAKTFILRKRIGGRIRNITVGRFDERRFTLAQARKAARNFIIDIEAGKDPASEARQQKKSGVKAGTVRAMFDDYVKAKRREGGRIRTLGEVEQMFDRHVLPVIGDRQADSVTRADITRLIDGIAEKSPGAARGVHSRLRAFYSWAIKRLDRLEANPATYAGRPAPSAPRKRVLSESELRALWLATDAEGFPWRAAVKLLILTGQRTDEVFQADWAEFDLASAAWTIPAERAKNGVATLVPLSPAALEIIKTTPVISGATKVFPSRVDGSRGPSGFTKLRDRLRDAVAKEMGGPVEHWTLHDIRRTVATGLQRLGVRLEVTEAVLNHVSGTRAGIVGVYQLHDYATEKRAALDLWASEVDRIVSGKPEGANVVKLGRA